MQDLVILANGINRAFDQYGPFLLQLKATDLQREHFCTSQADVRGIVRSALTDSSVLGRRTAQTGYYSKAKTLKPQISFVPGQNC